MRSGGPHHIGSAELFQFARGCVPVREAGDALEGRDGSGREVLLLVRKANPVQKWDPLMDKNQFLENQSQSGTVGMPG